MLNSFTSAFGQANPVIPDTSCLQVRFAAAVRVVANDGEKLDNPFMGHGSAINQIVENSRMIDGLHSRWC